MTEAHTEGDATEAPPPHSADFEEVALPFLPDVARFALSLTRDESEADDVVQLTFLNAFRGWHTFRPGTDARKWLFTIARNAWLRKLRKQNRLVLSEEGDLDAMPAVQAHARMTEEGLDQVMDRMELAPAIEEAVESLPEPHRSIIALVDVEGLSYAEAAEILEVPVGTVRSRLFRARRLIQEKLMIYAQDLGLAPAEGGDGGETP